MVGKLRAVMSVCFVLKSRWVLESLSRYFSDTCDNKVGHTKQRFRKMALFGNESPKERPVVLLE